MKRLNEDLKSGSFCPVYLLYGEEPYLKLLYKKKLRQAILAEDDLMNLSVFSGKGTAELERAIIDQAETMPFFAEHRLILVEETGFFKNATEKLADYISTMPAETILVFVESEVDKRGRLYKTVKSCGHVVEFSRQDNRTLTTWILGNIKKEGKQITNDALALFLEKTGVDMGTIEQELAKLFSYTMEQKAITREDVEAICTESIENRIFDMITAMINGQQRRALDLYYDLLSLREPPLRILFLIARQFNQLLLVKDLLDQGYDSNSIASKAGLPPYVARKTAAAAASFQKKVLQKALKACVEAEEGVKKGLLADKMAVELLLVQFSRKA